MTSSDSGFAVQTLKLSRKFGELVAVDGIDLEIKKGELFALLGPNGAGKTTTINMLCCLLKPSGGTARIMGHDILKQPFQVKKIIGVSPQETVISEHLNSLENIELIGQIHGMAAAELKSKAQEMLATMGLEARAKDQVRKFSGGMKRRLNIMMALVHNPQVVFLDEPTLGLDPQARRAIWEYISQLKREKTILLTTHYMDEAFRLCDRLVIMDHGRILVEGKPSDLVKRYVGQNVLEIAEPTDDLRSYVQSQGLKHEDLEHRLIIYGQESDHLFQHVSKAYCSEGCILRMATLEDVFLKLTGRALRE